MGRSSNSPPPKSVHNHPNESGGTWEWHGRATGSAGSQEWLSISCVKAGITLCSA